MSSAAMTLDALINRVGKIETPFTIELPDGESRKVGDGEPAFMVGLRNERALRAVRSLDEGNISEAYIHGDIDLEGDMLKPFDLRGLVRRPASAGRGLAFHRAAAVRSGLHQQAGDLLALQCRSKPLPEFSRSGFSRL